MWKKVRIDFTDTVKCQFCNRPITSGKAIVVQDETGKISFSGPSCAQNKNHQNVSNPSERIIDITKGCFFQKASQADNTDNQAEIEQGNSTLIQDIGINDLDSKYIEAYLLLRFEKLSHLKFKIESQKLNEIYQDYKKTGEISKQDEKYLKTVMYSDKYPSYTYQNLQAVYTAEYCLKSFIQNNSGKNLNFIQSTLSYLQNNLTLTEKQIQNINKQLENSNGRIIALDINAFVRKK